MKRAVLFASLLLMAALPAMAGTITGTIAFSGAATLDSSSVVTATAVTAWANPITINLQSLSDGSAGATATFTAPWSFNSGPIANFWSAGGYVFNLTSSTKSASCTTTLCGASGIGILTFNGGDATPFTWAFTTQDPPLSDGTGFHYSFSASSSAAPEPSSMMLLGAGLSGLIGLIRRKK